MAGFNIILIDLQDRVSTQLLRLSDRQTAGSLMTFRSFCAFDDRSDDVQFKNGIIKTDR